MQIKVIKALWGMTGSMSEMLARIEGANYDGVEFNLKDASYGEGKSALAQSPLIKIPQIHTLEIADLRWALEQAAELNAPALNCHFGRDWWPRDQALEAFAGALEVQREFGLPIAFETHRGRLLFNPWDTLYFLQQLPELRLTLDLSHWVCVCERFPDDQPEALALAAQRTVHVHARVGFPGGPQVNDPSAPEHASTLAWFETQWTAAIQARAAAEQSLLTITPEYGPPPFYMPTLPRTQQPVADLWDVCLWGANRVRERWGV